MQLSEPAAGMRGFVQVLPEVNGCCLKPDILEWMGLSALCAPFTPLPPFHLKFHQIPVAPRAIEAVDAPIPRIS